MINVSYEVSDSGGATDTNSFSITLNGTNDTPDATFLTAQTAAEDGTVVTGQLTADDPDNGTTLSYKLIGAPIDGLSIAADGSWEFDPTHASYQTLTNGEVLELTVNYSVTDSDGASDQAAFTLTLTGTNDAPKLTGLQSSLPGGSEDNPYAITKNQLLAGFSDADDGESLTLDISDLVATDDNGASVGSFELNSTDTGWTFTPNANFNGKVNLSYKVTDGIDSTDAANSFNLAAVNDVPALTGVKASLTAGTEDTAYTIATSDLLTGYTDADTGETETLAILGLSASNGFITKVPDTDNYTFTPNPDFNGEVTLNYVVSDGKGGNFLATNAFNIQAVNDKPVRTAGNVSTLFLIEDQPLASMGLAGLNYSVSGGIDEADQTLTYTVTELPDASKGIVYFADGSTAVTAQQTLSLEELRTLTFLPAENAAGQTTFSFSVTDSG